MEEVGEKGKEEGRLGVELGSTGRKKKEACGEKIVAVFGGTLACLG